MTSILAFSLLAALGAERADCRYVVQSADAQPAQSTLLPDTDLFRPLLADQREPRFYADYRRVHFRFANSALFSEGHGQDVDVSQVAFGGQFGLWGLRQAHGCDGLQVSIFAVVFAQFNLDSHSFDLLNADYLLGPVLTWRSGRLSARLRAFHQSSHLGDEFLLNYGIPNGVQRQNLSFEVIDVLFSFEDTWWRLYGGGGVLAFSSKDPDLASTPGILEYGFELRWPRPWRWMNSSLVPLVGGSFSHLQATSWSLNGSLEGGVEWSSPGSNQRIRALVVADRGGSPFSQFFFEKVENIGVQLQFEF